MQSLRYNGSVFVQNAFFDLVLKKCFEKYVIWRNEPEHGPNKYV